MRPRNIVDHSILGKSLEPYKIKEEKKPKRLPSNSSCSSASSSGQDYGFASSVSPMSVATGPNGSHSPSSSSDHEVRGQSKMSSHYAQISPLRGQGLPHPNVMGMQNHSTNGSPVKSYFQVSILQ